MLTFSPSPQDPVRMHALWRTWLVFVQGWWVFSVTSSPHTKADPALFLPLFFPTFKRLWAPLLLTKAQLTRCTLIPRYTLSLEPRTSNHNHLCPQPRASTLPNLFFQALSSMWVLRRLVLSVSPRTPWPLTDVRTTPGAQPKLRNSSTQPSKKLGKIFVQTLSMRTKIFGRQPIKP